MAAPQGEMEPRVHAKWSLDLSLRTKLTALTGVLMVAVRIFDLRRDVLPESHGRSRSRLDAPARGRRRAHPRERRGARPRVQRPEGRRESAGTPDQLSRGELRRRPRVQRGDVRDLE